jgi:photosystem II stability/assembly factor-like uncharacterized protein
LRCVDFGLVRGCQSLDSLVTLRYLRVIASRYRMGRGIVIAFLSFLVFIPSQNYAQWAIQQLPVHVYTNDIYFADSVNGWVAAGTHLLHTTDGGTTWGEQSERSYMLSGLSASEIWGAGFRDTILHTTDGGNRFRKYSLKNYFGFDSVHLFYKLNFIDSVIGWVAADGWRHDTIIPGLIKTTDGGNSWARLTLPGPSYIYQRIFIQFFDREYGLVLLDEAPMYRSMDGGTTWDSLSWPGYEFVMDMQFLTKRVGWLSSNAPVLMTYATETIDSGRTWDDHFLLFQCSDVTTFLHFTDTSNGWVVQNTCLNGGGNEIWHTSDGGVNWDKQLTYSPQFYFRPGKIFFADKDHGWVIGDSGVILKTTNGGIATVEPRIGAAPKNYVLMQNYPNPFNPQTTITFTIPSRSNVSIRIYDLLGREINELVNRIENPGTKSVSWNGQDKLGKPVASGVYYYALLALGGDGKWFRQTKKMLVIR